MSSFERVVKLACKPKAAPPKAKYLDPIVAATWSEDGAIADVCKALSPRFREPNAVVVFKALIVLHTMIRNGATDNVLSYLGSDDVLRLRNVANGQWDGYDPPRNLKHYAFYLDSRIRAYRDLKHDAIRVQSESNRDMRISQSADQSLTGLGSGNSGSVRSDGGLQRSKTLAGRKLRVMAVEKGLLRETKAVQKTIDALLACQFYEDNVQEELTSTALRMLVKDLLVLFQAVNEGVINVLESYFEMSHIDAEQALSLYNHFCKQAEKVMEYLSIARKFEHVLNIPIPQLRHAPISLAGALEEYLKDPNFEQNRLEYKANKATVDKASKAGFKAGVSGITASPTSTTTPPVPKIDRSTLLVASTSPVTSTSPVNTKLDDFFDSIEKDNKASSPSVASPSVRFVSQVPPSAVNPFLQQGPFISPQFTGANSLQGSFIQTQTTGFIHPQHTALSSVNPFSHSQPVQQTPVTFQQIQQPVQPNFIPRGILQYEPTGYIQPQITGPNPFRQSTFFAQNTGPSPFGAGPAVPPSPLPHPSSPFSNLGRPMSPSIKPSSLGKIAENPNPSDIFPNRPQSTPLPGLPAARPIIPVTTHLTGSKNPFGQPVKPTLPVPKPSTLQELISGALGDNLNNNTPTTAASNTGSIPTGSSLFGVGTNAGTQQLSFLKSSSRPFGADAMSSVASSFASKPNTTGNSSTTSADFYSFLPSQNITTTNTTSNLSNNVFPQPTGSIPPTHAPFSIGPLQSQPTGFGGIKPFKPASSFGTSLLESLPSPSNSTTPVKPTFTGVATNSTFSSPGFKSVDLPLFNPANSTLPFRAPTADNLNPKPQNPVWGAVNAHTDKQSIGTNGGDIFNSSVTPNSAGFGGLRPQITDAGSIRPFL